MRQPVEQLIRLRQAGCTRAVQRADVSHDRAKPRRPNIVQMWCVYINDAVPLLARSERNFARHSSSTKGLWIAPFLSIFDQPLKRQRGKRPIFDTMPYYYDTNYKDHTHGHDLVKRIYREVPRHSHHPTQYIVNDGKLIIEDQSLRNSNSVIYNSPGSTMWVQTSTGHWSSSSNHSHGSSTPSWSSNLHRCRGCYSLRELTGGYCYGCIEAKTVRPRIVEVVRDDRRLLSVPERRLLEYHR